VAASSKAALALVFGLTGLPVLAAETASEKPLPTDVITPWVVEGLKFEPPLLLTIERGGPQQVWEQHFAPVEVAQLSADGGSGKMLVKSGEPLMRVFGGKTYSKAPIYCAIGRKSNPLVYAASPWARGHTSCFADNNADGKFETQLRGVMDGVGFPTVRKLKSAKRVKLTP
jgi:hypothetical protein